PPRETLEKVGCQNSHKASEDSEADSGIFRKLRQCQGFYCLSRAVAAVLHVECWNTLGSRELDCAAIRFVADENGDGMRTIENTIVDCSKVRSAAGGENCAFSHLRAFQF